MLGVSSCPCLTGAAASGGGLPTGLGALGRPRRVQGHLGPGCRGNLGSAPFALVASVAAGSQRDAALYERIFACLLFFLA